MVRTRTVFRLRGLLFLLLPVIVVAATVFAASSIQRSAEQQAFERVQDSQQLLAAWLNRADALRTFLNTGSPQTFNEFHHLAAPYQAAVQTERTDVRHVSRARAALAGELQSERRWQKWALLGVAQIHRHGLRPLSVALTQPRTDAATAFQASSERLTAVMENQRKRDIADAAELGDGIVVLAVLILALGALAVARARRNQDRRAMEDRLREEHDRAAAERVYVEGRRRLSQMLLAAETSEEACEFAKAAIESRVAGSAVMAFECNNDSDRLALLTAAPEPVELARSLADAQPSSCLAIRLGAAQTTDPNESSTMLCELCGRGRYARCEPLFAAGTVTGSLRISHSAPLTAPERRAVDDTVAYLTPVLANLRNLTLAENRAQTDPLTELPNRRALDAMLKRMFAQANRTGAPLSLVLLDVDHFKDVNDTFGHECGDELLLTVASALAQSVRASDFVARLGGDEFVVVLPATNLEGAAEVAAKLGTAAGNARVLGFSWDITASLGIATYPGHGANVEAVMRSADAALYEAKRSGRNCVRLAPVIPPAATALASYDV